MSALRPARVWRVLLALVATLAILVPAAPVLAAGSFTFSDPQASSQFNQGINFSIRLTASEAPASTEVRLSFPGSIGPEVVPLPSATPGGTSTLRYTIDTANGGHIMPNTPITIVWAVYPQGGGAAVTSNPQTYRYQDETQQWRTLTDGIVTVHWTQGSQAFAQKAAGTAVKAIDSMATTLGITETEPVDFFIYADDASFRAALGPSARANVGGEAITEIRTLFAEFTPDIQNDAWVGITITHELTHQVIDDATTNPYRSLPRWLNEGTAVYESEGNTSAYQARLKSAIGSGEWWPLTALGWQFPTEYEKTILGYAESVSAVDYLVRTYGKDALSKLILAYKTGPTDDEAMQSVTGKDLAGFQADWYASLNAPAPSPFGPLPAPSGPVPPGWSAAAASPAPDGSTAPGAVSTAPGATSGPAASASTGGSQSPGSSGDSLMLVLLGIVVVSAALLVGIVVAGRRAGAP